MSKNLEKIGHNNPPLDPKETIQKNIIRKKPILDREPQFFKGTPLPSWMELSLIDSCNRSCSFCPKSDENIAPNTHQKMTNLLITKLYEDLKEIDVKEHSRGLWRCLLRCIISHLPITESSEEKSKSARLE